MSHKHWCEITGHEWECDGTQAVRLGDIHPSPCDTVSIDGIEMVPCPKHLPEVAWIHYHSAEHISNFRVADKYEAADATAHHWLEVDLRIDLVAQLALH